MKKIRIRHVNGVNLNRTFTAHLCGGGVEVTKMPMHLSRIAMISLHV